jgi:hypothetical protein
MSATNSGKLKETTPEQAMELLQSALAYCQRAGMKVEAGNPTLKDGRTVMAILIPDGEVIRTENDFRLAVRAKPVAVAEAA